MNAKHRQSGLSLTETAIVIAVMALLAGLALPAVRVVMESFESGDNARSMISSALASARALAAKHGHYVGVRFQKAYNFDSTDPLDPLNASQYMIFIIHDSSIMASGYRALEGVRPIKLPDSIGVMDMTIVTGHNINVPTNAAETRIDDPRLSAAQADAMIDERIELMDTTAFSIVFSPAGKLVTQGVRVRRKRIADDVFNENVQVDVGIGMFYQDDYFEIGAGPDLGLGPEPSRNRFLIYDRIELKKAWNAGVRAVWSDYLVGLVGETIYINPHTGTIILKD